MRYAVVLCFFISLAVSAGEQEYSLYLDLGIGGSVMNSDISQNWAAYFPNEFDGGTPSSVTADLRAGIEVFRNFGVYGCYQTWLNDFRYKQADPFEHGTDVEMHMAGGGLRFILPVQNSWVLSLRGGLGSYTGELHRVPGDPYNPDPPGIESGEWSFSDIGSNFAAGYLFSSESRDGNLLAGVEAGFHLFNMNLEDEETGESGSGETTIIPEMKAFVSLGLDL